MSGQPQSPRRIVAPGRWLSCLVAITAVVIGVLVPSGAAFADPSAAAPATALAKSVSSGIRPMTLDGFDAGNIISDEVFTNKNSMTEAQIQTFFNSKVSRCLGGIDESGRQIVCLKDFTITSVDRPADKYCSGYTGAPNESAARIIYRVAQSCNINPQVLIVMLQKEQGLVTHTWPSMRRFDAALGQGCPDGGVSCDPKYVGFFHQIYGAARQMQIYMEGRYFTYYAPGKTWNIYWHPPVLVNGQWVYTCGAGPVYVANKATSALYYYTPYQPNAAAMRAGYGEGDSCSAYGNRNFYNYFTDWFGPTRGSVHDPIGNVEAAESLPGSFRLRGWLADPNSAASIGVHVYVNGVGYPFVANGNRPDVGAAYPDLGSAHGFDVTVPATTPGDASVCIYGINVGPGSNRLLGCLQMRSYTGSPMGYIDSAVGVSGGVQVSGWTLDPDVAAPTDVHVYVDSAGIPLRADAQRSDVGAMYPAHGSAHGFAAAIPASPGVHQVCAYGINVGPGANALLGCVSVTVPVATDLGKVPVGNFEGAAPGAGGATLSGWTLDPDTIAPIWFDVSVDSAVQTFRADANRTDVGASYPLFGPRHGFSTFVTMTVGSHNVCITAINNGSGGNVSLGCRTVVVSSPAQDAGRSPFGYIDSLTPVEGGATLSGWMIDPDTTSPIAVHVYVDGVGTPFMANKERSDVAALYPASGSRHGFRETIPMTVGTHNVCVYAINNGAGPNPLFGCRNVTVVSGDRARPPIGYIDSVTATTGAITVWGWTIDPDTTEPIAVHVYVDGVGTPFMADKDRPDVATAYPASGPRHGFKETFAAAAGTHNVCVYAMNNAAGANPLLGCVSVNVP